MAKFLYTISYYYIVSEILKFFNKYIAMKTLKKFFSNLFESHVKICSYGTIWW